MVSIIVFLAVLYLSIILIVFLIAKKIKKLRDGKILIDHIGPAPEINLKKINTKKILGLLSYYSKRFLFSFTLTTAKIWIILSHKAKKSIKKRFPKIAKIIAPERNPNGKNSEFLNAIVEYKTKIKKFKQRIQEE